MVADIENLIIEHLKALRAEVASLKAEVKENTLRLGRIEIAVAGTHREIAYTEETTAEQSLRIDRLVNRIERIEARLELT
jgi:chromosome segregation ATPase